MMEYTVNNLSITLLNLQGIIDFERSRSWKQGSEPYSGITLSHWKYFCCKQPPLLTLHNSPVYLGTASVSQYTRIVLHCIVWDFVYLNFRLVTVARIIILVLSMFSAQTRVRCQVIGVITAMETRLARTAILVSKNVTHFTYLVLTV